jgi:hypothetical protein
MTVRGGPFKGCDKNTLSLLEPIMDLATLSSFSRPASP